MAITERNDTGTGGRQGVIENGVRERAGGTVLERPAAPPTPVAPRVEPRGGLQGARRRLLLDGVRVPLAIFLLSRVYVFLLGAIAMQSDVALPPVPALDFYMPQLYGLSHYLLQPWRNWDGHWYTLIALEGYEYDRATTAFYPLYPLLLRGLALFLDGRIELAGVLISNAALLGALTVLYQLIQLDFPRPVARRAILYLALFPTAFYFSALYNESLFLLLSAACLYAARRDRWWLAGALGFLAALTRTHGILLLLPLAVLFLRQQGIRPWHRRSNPLSLALVPAGLMVYMVHLRRVWDDPLVMLRAQKGWDRYSSDPLQTLRDGVAQVDGCAVRDWGAGVEFCWAERIKEAPTLATIRDLNWRWGLSESDFVELVATVLLLALGLLAFRLLPLAYSTYLAAGIVLPLWSPSAVHPLMSMHRFTLILFPAFIVLALLGRWRPVHGAIVVVSSLLLAFFTIQFASWLWVA